MREFANAKKDEATAEQAAFEAAHKVERGKLKADFTERDVRPEALDRIAALVAKQIDRGEKHALLFQFPSEWLPDQGRAVTNRDPEWHRRLEGFPQRTYAHSGKELAPRGFQLRSEILDWPNGMPGDVGFILTWKRQDEE